MVSDSSVVITDKSGLLCFVLKKNKNVLIHYLYLTNLFYINDGLYTALIAQHIVFDYSAVQGNPKTKFLRLLFSAVHPSVRP